MGAENKGLAVFKSELDLKNTLNKNYVRQINNYFGEEKKALKFLSGVMAAVQRNPKLLQCSAPTVINSFMMMAQLELMPSDVSGEAYVLPYNNKYGMTAQFQLGYQGIVTLLYRAGARDIVAEVVYENDEFSCINGVIRHNPDVFSDERGKPKGAYAIIRLANGSVAKVMSKKDILAIGQKFSKSFKSDHTPWDIANDPQLWMWKKTVLKQCAKLVPKNEAIVKAIAEDNKDSIIQDRLEAAEKESESLKMGSLLEGKKNDDGKENEIEEVITGSDAESDPGEDQTK